WVDVGDARGPRLEAGVRRQADYPDIIAGAQRLRAKLRAAHRSLTDQRRVVLHDREIVQRVHEHDLRRDLERAGKGDAYIAERHRHRVAVDDHEAAFGIDDQTGAVVVALG